jgi:phosphoribosylglycinamide formyltransferase-1
MYIAGLMSGSGSNLRKILEYQQALKERDGKSPFEMKVIFTDNMASKAAAIAKDYNIACLANDIDRFYNLQGFAAKNKGGTPEQRRETREHYDEMTLDMLETFSFNTGFPIRCIALGGYMSYLTPSMLESFLVINVHPADLTILNQKGERKYKGDKAVELAIRSGERTIRSSMHIAREKVDEGELLMVSAPLKVNMGLENFAPDEILQQSDLLAKVADRNQERLKEAGDWVIFPKTLEMIARGWFAMKDGKVHYKTSDEGEWKEGPMRLES